MYFYVCLRIDVQHTLFHHINLVFPYCFSRSYDLPVQIREAYLVIIHEIKCSYSTTDQSLAYISSHAPYTEYRYFLFLKCFHSFLT